MRQKKKNPAPRSKQSPSSENKTWRFWVCCRCCEKFMDSEAHMQHLISSRFELDATTNVLKDAESLNRNQFGYEESYACTSSQLRDLESGEADEWGMKDSLHEADSFIEIAIQKQKEQLSAELSRIDARMMRNVTGIQQLQLKLGPVSSIDYQIVLLPLVKYYINQESFKITLAN